jgi:hypothetical protein
MSWQIWWDREGSAMRPLENEDTEEFARRITAIAWSNGEFVHSEAAQAESEADKVIIEYHEATIKRLEAELKARGQA